MLNFIRKNFLIILIIIIAGFFRFYKISSYMEFLGDQGRDVYIVRKFLTSFDLIFIGPQTSIGNMYLGPFYYYLMAPFLLLFNYNPAGPAVMVVCFSLLTTYLIFYVYKKLFLNNFFAYLASFLYAISPVVIKYSNFSWNPNVMPFFSLLFFYFSYLVLFKKKFSYLPIVSLSFIFALNSHYLALVLIPIFFMFTFVSFIHNKYNLKTLIPTVSKPFFISLFLLLLSFLPQFLFDIKHDGQNTKALIQFFTVRQTTINLKPYKAIPQIFPLWTQINTRLVFAKNTSFGQICTIIFTVLILVSLFSKTKYKNNYILLVLSILISVICLGLYKQHIYDHYFGFLFPILFLLFSSTIQIISEFKFFKLISIPLVIISIFLSFNQNPLLTPPNNQLQVTKEITTLISQQANNQPFNLALLAKNNYDPPYRYFLELNHQPLHLLKDQKTDQLFVICEPHQDINCQPEGNPLWDIAAFGVSHVTNKWQINNIEIYKLIPTK